MEALDEAVGGTAGCLASGALLTAATLLLFTGSLTLALTTVAGVVVVLTCFLGYLAERGYSLGVIEAIATTIFIGLACDYCVHVLQVHRSGTGELTHTSPTLDPRSSHQRSQPLARRLLSSSAALRHSAPWASSLSHAPS